MDLLIAATALVLFLPVVAIVAILVKWNLGSPVLFVQTRAGRFGRLFPMYKFRTMKSLCDRAGNPLPDSERMTWLGGFLRKSSLDELPELWNILRGEMSLVGPRPLLPEYLELYTDRQNRRHQVRPGLTGWAQVNGRNAVTWEERFEMDVWYVENQSLRLDLLILIRTVSTVLLQSGASPQGQVTMPPFAGSRASIDSA